MSLCVAILLRLAIPLRLAMPLRFAKRNKFKYSPIKLAVSGYQIWRPNCCVCIYASSMFYGLI
jgi:hypothetical protein